MRLQGVRFAPSPTGRFHIGNLRTAWISHQLASLWNEPWIVRFEDIDRPRVVQGAQEKQLRDLTDLGWIPSQVVLQSEARDFHWDEFVRAADSGQLYPCACSRKEIQDEIDRSASAPHQTPPEYTGFCRHLEQHSVFESARKSGRAEIGWRFKDESPDGTRDPIIARLSLVESLSIGKGAAPKTFTPSYHWACALDDAQEHYAVIVRASDLKSSLRVQRAIQTKLFPGKPLPAVFHTALVTQADGSRLEKRTQGITLFELNQRGVQAAQLLLGFERSLRTHLPTQLLAPSEIFDELPTRISLQDLGLAEG